MVYSNAIWNDVFYVGNAEKILKTRSLYSDAIWNDVLEVGTAEKKLIARTPDRAFWRFFGNDVFIFSD